MAVGEVPASQDIAQQPTITVTPSAAETVDVSFRCQEEEPSLPEEPPEDFDFAMEDLEQLVSQEGLTSLYPLEELRKDVDPQQALLHMVTDLTAELPVTITERFTKEIIRRMYHKRHGILTERLPVPLIFPDGTVSVGAIGGGMATVYLGIRPAVENEAEDSELLPEAGATLNGIRTDTRNKLHDLVVLKVGNPAAGSMDKQFRREGHHYEQLSDVQSVPRKLGEGVLPQTDFTPPRPYLVLEYIHGSDLSRLIGAAQRLGGSISLPAAVKLATDYLETLQIMADHQILHRDIKPSNAIHAYDGSLKVIDFGIAKSSEHYGQTTGSTVTVSGTLQYMAPELRYPNADGKANPPTEASEMYSFGATLHHLLTGRHFDATMVTPESLGKSIFPIPGSSKREREVQKVLSDLVLALVRKQPYLRPSRTHVLRVLRGLQEIDSRVTFQDPRTEGGQMDVAPPEHLKAIDTYGAQAVRLQVTREVRSLMRQLPQDVEAARRHRRNRLQKIVPWALIGMGTAAGVGYVATRDQVSRNAVTSSPVVDPIALKEQRLRVWQAEYEKRFPERIISFEFEGEGRQRTLVSMTVSLGDDQEPVVIRGEQLIGYLHSDRKIDSYHFGIHEHDQRRIQAAHHLDDIVIQGVPHNATIDPQVDVGTLILQEVDLPDVDRRELIAMVLLPGGLGYVLCVGDRTSPIFPLVDRRLNVTSNSAFLREYGRDLYAMMRQTPSAVLSTSAPTFWHGPEGKFPKTGPDRMNMMLDTLAQLTQSELLPDRPLLGIPCDEQTPLVSRILKSQSKTAAQ